MELNDICELIVDCEHKTAPVQEVGYPSIRTPNIGPGYFILDGVNRVSEETYRRWTRRAIPKPGDLVMAREAPVGNVAMIPQGLQPCLGQRTLLIRPIQSRVDSAFLNYLLNGPYIQQMIHAKTNGVTVPHLNMKDVRAMQLPELPPLPLQRRIAGILSAYDDLIENSQRRIKILEEMARAIYREWFVYFRFPGHENHPRVASPLGEIPQGWEVKPLEAVCALITDGAHHSPASVADGYPMASVKDMRDWGIDINSCRRISEDDFENLIRNNCKPLKNDVLIAKDGSYLKHTFVVGEEEDLVILSSIAILRPNPHIRPNYLSFTLREPTTKARMTGFVSGVAIPRIVLKDFRKFQILTPPPSIQAAWSMHVDPAVEMCRKLVSQIQNLRRTRDLLLPRLLSGQIEVEAA